MLRGRCNVLGLAAATARRLHLLQLVPVIHSGSRLPGCGIGHLHSDGSLDLLFCLVDVLLPRIRIIHPHIPNGLDGLVLKHLIRILRIPLQPRLLPDLRIPLQLGKVHIRRIGHGIRVGIVSHRPRRVGGTGLRRRREGRLDDSRRGGSRLEEGGRLEGLIGVEGDEVSVLIVDHGEGDGVAVLIVVLLRRWWLLRLLLLL
mmetsp:Transcript_1251/g.2838  ORF Transcript_1251/g.2838 Transcript_1251/m.2838 type:complete len:201 (+) Transcript_1251:861-1463(+)